MSTVDVIGQHDDQGGSLELVVQAGRAALDEETGRAERYDAKARGLITLAGTWFAVVQAVAAVALRPGTPRGWVIAVAVLAALAGVLLFAAMWSFSRVWKLRPQPAITQATLAEMAESAQSERDRAAFDHKLVDLYRHLLGHAQEVNKARADALDAATRLWWAALILAFGELAVALASRIFSV